MKNPDKLAGKNAALLVGSEALELYLKEISWKLRSMRGQADVLETAIQEIKQQQRDHSVVTEPAAAQPNSDQGTVHAPADNKEQSELTIVVDGKASY